MSERSAPREPGIGTASDTTASRPVSAIRLVPAVAAWVTIAAGAVALTGWALGLPVLTSLLPGQASMHPTTAFGLLLLGGGLLGHAIAARTGGRTPLGGGAASRSRGS